MKTLLIAILLLANAATASAECLPWLQGVLRERDHMLASMLNEESAIIRLDRSLFYLQGSYASNTKPATGYFVNPGGDFDFQPFAFTTFFVWDAAISAPLIASEYVGNSISSTTAATSRKISVSDISEVYNLLIEANLGEGRNLQSFVQDIKSQNAVNVNTAQVASVLSAGNQRNLYCADGYIMSKSEVRESVLMALGSKSKNN